MSVQHHLFSADHVVPLAKFASKALTAAQMHARINLIAVGKFVLMMTPYLSKSWCVVRLIAEYDHGARTNFTAS